MREVIILVGIPGSGKSTIVQKYFQDYERISQDACNGHRGTMEKHYKETIRDTNKSIIVDRTNINRLQRSWFIRQANESNKIELIRCIKLIADPELCIERIMARTDHETIKNLPIDKVQRIVYNFVNQYERVTRDEGFDQILYINSNVLGGKPGSSS